MSVDEIAAAIKADSLGYLTLDGLYRACGEAARMSARPSSATPVFRVTIPRGLKTARTRTAFGAFPLLAETGT